MKTDNIVIALFSGLVVLGPAGLRSPMKAWVFAALALTLLCAPLPAQVPAPNGPGSALNLDGNDDYVRIPDSPALRFGNHQFTIEFWFKPTTLAQGSNYLVSRSSPNTSSQAAVVFGYSSNKVEFYALGHSGDSPYPGSALTLPNTNWHHIAYSYDGTIWSGYLDGTQVFSVNRVFTLSTAPNDWTIGVPFPGAGAEYTVAGAFDEVRLWNYGLVTAEIQEAMRRQLFGNEYGLAGYWRCDDGAGTTVTDQKAGGANPATLVNGPLWAPSTVYPFAPGVITRQAMPGAPGSVTLNGAVFFNGPATTGWFQWGLNSAFENQAPAQNLGSGGGSNYFWSQTITGLTPGVTYHYQAVATNLHGPSYGLDRTFRLPATFTVLNTNDSGPGSLRQAIQDSGAGDTIVFAPNVTNTIVLTNGELVVNQSITIQGPGARALSVSAGGLSRLFRVSAPNVALAGLTLREGNSGLSPGGAINLETGQLGVTNCVFSNNFTSGQGGALHVLAGATSVLHGCTFNGNRAAGSSAPAGGAVGVRGTLQAVQCTFAGNTMFTPGPSQIGGGAIYVGGGSATLLGCTLANNGASRPGQAIWANPPCVLRNCIVASTGSGDVGITSAGYNLIRVGGSVGVTYAPTDLVGTGLAPLEPLLGPLQDNGGPTPTIAPLPGSPALETGDDALVNSLGLATDQRGQPRLSGCHVDIGAYETALASCDPTVVRNLSGNGRGSLREAVLNSPAGSVITFPPQLAGTITLTSEILLNKNLTIEGPGADRLTISGGDASRVFHIVAGATGALSGLSITHGRVIATDLGACAEGGGVLNYGSLRLTNCVLTANSVQGAPGADAFLSFGAGPGGCGQGGAIANYGDLTVMGCTLAGNAAQGGVGGGGGSDRPRGGLGGAGRGGALWSGPGRLTVLDSTLGTNTASGGVGGAGTDVNGGHNDAAVGGFGGAGSGGGIEALNGTVEVRGCTLLENQARGGQGGRGGNSGNGRGGPGGGGGNGSGGGLWVASSAAAPFLVNCTVYGNEAHNGRGGDGGLGTGWPNGATGVRGLGQGGGLHVGGGPGFVPRVYLCTITANFADGRLGTVGGGGVEGRAECRSTLIAGNFASDAIIGAPDCAGDFAGSSFNLIGIGDGSTGFTVPGNLVGSLAFPLDPKLGLLGNYGGPTLVLPLLACSPALNRGASSLALDPVAPILTDQRGFPRFVGLAVDIGAFESPGPAVYTLADDVPGSLRDAIACAAPGSIITFAPHVRGTLQLRDQLVIDKDLTIEGPGAANLRLVCTQNRVFFISLSTRVELRGLAITGESRSQDPPDPLSPSIYGGGIQSGAAELTMVDCLVHRCLAMPSDFDVSAYGGGLHHSGGTLTLVRCTFAENRAIGASTLGGGLHFSGGSMFATNCTFFANTAEAHPNPMLREALGGGLYVNAFNGHESWLVSCTLQANSTRTSPGGWSSGGGCFLRRWDLSVPTYVENTIFAGNLAESGPEVAGQLGTRGYNLLAQIDDNVILLFDGVFLGPHPTDLVAYAPNPPIDPRLGALDYYGGSTPVLPLLAGSPALDRGHSFGAATDQRGFPRPWDNPAIPNASGGDGSDIGAYEAQGPPILSIRLGVPLGGINTVILSWPNPSTGYVLEQTASMSAPGGGWTDVIQTPVVNGANKEVTLLATGQVCFFRLRHP